MLIAVEGIDGCGKETQINLLGNRLKFTAFKYPTRNFGILNDYLEKKVRLSKKSLFHLFLADIANEQEKVALSSASGIAITDRYVFSTIAYEVDGIDYDNAKRIVESTGFLKPDLVLYLDITPEISQIRKRGQKGSEGLDRYEENAEYLSFVRSNYLRLWKEGFLAQKWAFIDAKGSIDEVHAQILSALREII